jgi:hypothetical protein
VLHRDLLVVVNGYDLGKKIPRDELAMDVRPRGGDVVCIERNGVIAIHA